MNWLSHLLLSKTEIDYQLGQILADPLKGRPWEGASENIKQGMKMHLAIDEFTDSHSLFSQSKSKLGNKGYLKGVVLDILYDHFLSRSWDEYCQLSFSHFIDQFYSQAISEVQVYPKSARGFVLRLIDSKRLETYGSFEGLADTFKRVETRFSLRLRSRDSLFNYMQSIQSNYDELEQLFHQFFPQLVVFFKQHRRGSQNHHFLK